VVCCVGLGGGWLRVMSSCVACGFYGGGGVCFESAALRDKSECKSKYVKAELSKL
jgi:hypothetical protein